MTEPWVTQRLEDWRTRFRSLDRNGNPPGVDLRRWRRFLNDTALFFKTDHALKAIECGWDEYQLFGTDDGKNPMARVDCLGVLWFAQGADILDVSDSSIGMQHPTGAPMRCYVRTVDPRFIRLPWDPPPGAPGEALGGLTASGGAGTPPGEQAPTAPSSGSSEEVP